MPKQRKVKVTCDYCKGKGTLYLPQQVITIVCTVCKGMKFILVDKPVGKKLD